MTVSLHNPVKALLAAGGTACGTLVTLPSAPLAQLLTAVGFDWLCFDMEHGPMSPETVHAMIAATAAGETVPLVRVPATTPWLVKPALDAGALGIIFPFVSSPEAATEAAAATHYPPTGRRGFGPFLAPARWGVSMADYAAQADQEMLTVVMVETREAVERVDEILAIDGIDVAFVAPFDLSQSLGCPGEFDNPIFVEALATAERRILDAGVVLGGLAVDPSVGEAMRSRGYRFLMLAFDGLIIDRAFRSFLDQVRD